MGAFVQELFSLSTYKPSQGRMARQGTFAALAVIVVLAAWSLYNHYNYSVRDTIPAPPAAVQEQDKQDQDTKSAAPETSDKTTPTPTSTTDAGNSTSRYFYVYVLPFAVLAAGLWTSFRVIQLPSFADFLISVEGEMNKVSWPARGELLRASVVVMFVIFFLAFILFAYDYALVWIMQGIEGFLNWVGTLFQR